MTARQNDEVKLRLGLPKGRMEQGVLHLLGDAGIDVRTGSRSYRPVVGIAGVEAKMLKPQNIVEMLHVGSRDIGFAGADWVSELNADLVELLDTGMDPVRVVAAAPEAFLVNGVLPEQPLMIASEYERLTRRWIESTGMDAQVVRTFGATEVFPPEDADIIVDNTATGSTLRANGLEIVHELMRSSTRLYANPAAMEDPEKREVIDLIVLLIESVLEARKRVMLELNVSAEDLEAVIAILPCMREPTVSTLHASTGYAVKAAVPRGELVQIIPRLKASGGTDIVVTTLSQIVP